MTSGRRIRIPGLGAAALVLFVPTTNAQRTAPRIGSQVSSSLSTSSVIEWTPRKNLIYSDLVVRATILDVNNTSIPIKEWMSADDRDKELPVTELKINVHEVLKGAVPVGEMAVIAVGGHAGTRGVVPDMSFDFTTGKEVVLVLWYSKSIRGGTYYFSTNAGRYDEENGKWVNHGHQGSVLEIGELRSIAKSAEPSVLARSARAIVIGKVVGVQSERGRDGRLEHIKVDVIETLKGDVGEIPLEFMICRKGCRSDPWNVPFPVIRKGEEWICLLQRYRGSWIPFAGTNGLLQVEGDSLIRANRVRLKNTKHALVETIRSER